MPSSAASDPLQVSFSTLLQTIGTATGSWHASCLKLCCMNMLHGRGLFYGDVAEMPLTNLDKSLQAVDTLVNSSGSKYG